MSSTYYCGNGDDKKILVTPDQQQELPRRVTEAQQLGLKYLYLKLHRGLSLNAHYSSHDEHALDDKPGPGTVALRFRFFSFTQVVAVTELTFQIMRC